jgi:hypothetical protein
MSEEIKKIGIVEIRADTSDVQKGIKDIKGNLEGINNTPVDKPFKSLKNELKEATQEAQKIGREFGTNSQQFASAAKRVAELRDRFQETNQAVAAFNPDNKLQALVSLSRGAIGALQGVSGAMAFVGVSSENAQQTIAKLQGLMAFSDALNSLDDIKNSFKNFNTVLSGSTVLQKANAIANSVTAGTLRLLGVSATTASAGFQALKVAIISTGIGALVIGITALISKISDWTSGTKEAEKAQERLAIAIKSVNDQLANSLKDIDFQSQKEILSAKAAGKTKQEIHNLEVKALEQRSKEYESAYQKSLDNQIRLREQLVGKDTKISAENLKTLNEANEATIKAGRDWEDAKNAIELKGYSYRAELADEARDKAKQNQEKTLAGRKAAAEKLKQQYEEESKNLQAHLKELNDLEKETVQSIAERGLSERDKEVEELKNTYKTRVTFLESTIKEELALLEKAHNAGKISTAKYEADKIELEKKYSDIGIDFSIDYQGKKLEIEKKYHDLIKSFILNETTTEFQQRKQQINSQYEELIKNADEKEKEILEKLRKDKLNQADRQESTRIASIKSETNEVITKVENRVLATDTPEERASKLKAVNDVEVELENAQFAAKLETLNGQQAEIELATAQHNARLTELADQQAKDEKAIDDAKSAAKLATLDQIGNAADSLSELLGKNTVAGKGLAVATTTIDTYLAAQKAYTSQLIPGDPSSPFRAALAAGSAVVAGLLRVKQILAVKVPGKGGNGSASSVQAPTNSTAPVINSTQLSPSVQVQDVRVTNTQEQVVKAYISQKDLNNNEDRQNFLEKLSSI